ncbi:hypothetical protein MAR_001325 [Mya arenaria]|uniref:Uncharacterized protein n=1 Tax=Mya arenaria TaxID=6604 RepID=A0ABY7FD18_MYAAR|nr:hypothetical protein MAR_001325 [Mya arenaria]
MCLQTPRHLFSQLLRLKTHFLEVPFSYQSVPNVNVPARGTDHELRTSKSRQGYPFLLRNNLGDVIDASFKMVSWVVLNKSVENSDISVEYCSIMTAGTNDNSYY